MSDKRPQGLSVGFRVEIDQERLFESIPMLLSDLEELQDLVSEWNQPEAGEIVKRCHNRIVDLIDVK